MNSDDFQESKYFNMYCNTVYEGGIGVNFGGPGPPLV